MSGRRSRAFRNVGKVRLGRSFVDLTHEHKTTCDMGQLIPIMWLECVPGDVFKLSNEIVARLQPTVAPILHEVNVYTHTFFVPLRILFAEWERFLAKGDDGDTDVPLPVRDDYSQLAMENTLLDYFGLPLGIDPQGAYPLIWLWRVYNLIWNEYYRDEELQDEVDLNQNEVLYRAWEKDYFTVARPAQQRGTAPAVNLSGIGGVNFTGSDFDKRVVARNTPGASNYHYVNIQQQGSQPNVYYNAAIQGSGVTGGLNVVTPFDESTRQWLGENNIDFSQIATFNVKDLRLVVQLQKWQERNMRAGTRYIEILKAHFDSYPTDERLQRPEYIGGTKSPLIISEVLQTSSSDTTTPQGNLAGHGVVADRTKIGNYKCKEHGYIMTMLSIMPRTAYQQGIHRSLLRRTVEDFYWPEFAHLSEQAVMMSELYATNDMATNMEVFGYQGQYDELRYIPSKITGKMRNVFDYWHLGRKFDNKPLLNSSFVECHPDKRIFAVQNEDGYIVNYASVIHAYRPIPVIADPGWVDHF